MTSQHKRNLPDPEYQERSIRVERSEDFQIESDEGQSWAVSYSDLLMVLLSFFVIFFSFDEKQKDEKEQIIRSIEANIGKSGGKKSSTNASNTEPVVATNAPTGNVLSSVVLMREIGRTIKGLKIENTKQDSSLLFVRLPDNIFASREFTPNQNVKKFLKDLTKKLMVYSDQIDVYVIGHADKAAISRKSKEIASNFSLSSLRAASALDVMIGLGFPSKRLFVQGAADNERSTRSLTIKIIVRGQSPTAH